MAPANAQAFNGADERTPLIRHDRTRRASEEAVVDDDDPSGRRADSNGLVPIRRHSSVQGATGGWLAPEAGDVHRIASHEEENDEASPAKPSPFYDGISRTRFWVMMIGILSTYFIATFDSTLMASSHPVITSYFNASNTASWLSTAFLLTSTSFQPLFGRMSDTFGRRPLYIVSLVMFAATTAWCALAQSIYSLIVARAFCGLGAGGVMSMVCFQFPNAGLGN